MAETGENFASITNDVLGFGNMAFDSAMAQYEVQYGAAYGVGAAAFLATIEMSPPVALAIGTAVGMTVGALLNNAVAAAFDGLNNQAQIAGAINLDGQGLSMPDPVTGMGYY